MKFLTLLKYLVFTGICLGSSNVWAQVCARMASCEEMGFKMNASQCAGLVSLNCPFDTAKVFCNQSTVGEIKIFAGKETSIPKGWILADGRSLARTTYPKLYALYGTSFGGTASNFNIPNLNKKFVIGTSSSYSYGSTGGEEKHTLTVSELPSHNHGWTGQWGTGHPDSPNDVIDVGHAASYPRYSQDNYQGSNSPHENMPPYLSLFYILYTGV